MDLREREAEGDIAHLAQDEQPVLPAGDEKAAQTANPSGSDEMLPTGSGNTFLAAHDENSGEVATATVGADNLVEAAERVASQTHQATAHPARSTRSRRPRRLLFATLIVVLLVLVAAVPILHGLAPSGTPSAAFTPTAIASATVTPNGTPNPNAFSWVGTLRNYAQQQYIDDLISHMSLDEEIGQMIQVSFFNTPTPEQWVMDEIAQDHIGSVILYNANLGSRQDALSWTSKLQASAKVPLLIGADVEGGPVNRFQAIFGDLPDAYQMAYHNNATAYTQQVGKQVAQDFVALGMNNDYAPVVDVDSGVGAAGGQLNGRMFGSTPAQVSKLAGAFLTGLQQSGQVVGTLKHFPGLGDVPVDPHAKLYTVTRSLSQLQSIDWAPYKSLIATGQVDMIMSTHVIIQAVDPSRPASLSQPVITGILRNQLHYNGVVITDAIYMQALINYPLADRILYAVEAGNDIISAAYDRGIADLALSTIRTAVQNGTITKQRIDDSVRRILALKLKYGILTMPKA